MVKKLTSTDYKNMWGEDGPYSQVRLSEETRILDDHVSRVFLVVEAEINPFTLEYVLKHSEKFAGDEPVMQLLDHAEFRGKFGYIIGAGEVELRDEGSRQYAREQAAMATRTIIRMHEFVIKECGLKKDFEYMGVKDEKPHDGNLVWNDRLRKTEAVEGGVFGNRALVGSKSGVKNNKMRFFFVLAFKKDFDYKKESIIYFAKTLSEVSADLKVGVEDAETFMEYVLITALVPFDVAPEELVEILIEKCNSFTKKPFFKKDYYVSNVKRPTVREIVTFLKSLS